MHDDPCFEPPSIGCLFAIAIAIACAMACDAAETALSLDQV
jgi:hypothetical protein